jgi:hypothetical protein
MILPDTFYVRTPTIEIYVMVQRRLFKMGFHWFDRDLDTSLCYGKDHCICKGFDNDEKLGYSPESFYKEDNIQEVSIADLFIAEIPKKQIVIEILPWSVLIDGQTVYIGAFNVSLSFFKNFIKEMENPQNIIIANNVITKGRHGFIMEDEKITWETWDKFVAEFNKNIK